MTPHHFRRRGGFDPTRPHIASREDDIESDRQARSFATTFLAAHVPVPAAVARSARVVQAHVIDAHDGGACWAELGLNNVANARQVYDSRRKSHDAERLAKDSLPVLAAFGMAPDDVELRVWLACHEVDFHIDEGLAEDAAFIVWHVAGPAKALDLPNLGQGVVTNCGDAVLFDGMQPHGVRLPNSAGRPFKQPGTATALPVRSEDITVYYSMDVPLTVALDARLGIRRSRMGRYITAYGVDEGTGRTSFVTRDTSR